MVIVQKLKVTAGYVARCLLSSTKKLYTYVSEKRDHFHRRKISSSRNDKPCPDVHIQSDITGLVIDDHSFHSCPSTEFIQLGGFPLFTHLPPELRLDIWRLASTAGRVVELQAMDREHGVRASAAPRPPAMLHACHESREVALRIYKPWFWIEGQQPKKPIHIDPVNDIVFFRHFKRVPTPQTWDWIVGPRSIWRRQLRKLQRVAFVYDDNPMDLKNSDERFCIRMTEQFRSLRELICYGRWIGRSGRLRDEERLRLGGDEE